jgi:hypothetical protein
MGPLTVYLVRIVLAFLIAWLISRLFFSGGSLLYVFFLWAVGVARGEG